MVIRTWSVPTHPLASVAVNVKVVVEEIVAVGFVIDTELSPAAGDHRYE